MRPTTRVLAAALCALLGGACTAGEGQISVLLTDAPDDLQSVVVTIDEVALQPGATEDSGRIVLRDDPVTVDLLTLSNDVAPLVEDATVPAGDYAQLRFVISGAYVEVGEDREWALYSTPGYPEVPDERMVTGMLETPSWRTSGFKVKVPGGPVAIDGEQRIVVVDFDVAESLSHRTGADTWVMRPVLTATDVEVTASLQVVATPEEGSAPDRLAAQLLEVDGDLAGAIDLTDEDADGALEGTFLYLDPADGPFALRLRGPDGDPVETVPATPLPVDLSPGAVESVELGLP
jgi:hypothetical protein